MKKVVALKIFGIFSTLFIIFFACNTFATDSSASYCAFNNCSATQLTYDNFLKIKVGSKYIDVINVLGEESLKDTNIINGLENNTYVWKTSDSEKSIFITFVNGIVITKEQYKLTNKIVDLSKEKTEQLKRGMSYNDVKSILGEGELRSESKDTKVYSWFNSISKNISCTFNKDKLEIFMEQ